MSWQRWWLAAGLSAAMLVNVEVAHAEGSSSCSAITRANLVSCASGASLARRAGRAGVDAAEGRITATDPWFPSAPLLALTAARRQSSEGTTLNWSASLGVGIELAGQRGALRRAAVAERDAERKNVTAIERANAAEAWRAYFEVLAAEQALELVLRLEAVSKRLWEAAKSAADRGAIPGVEADLAEAAYVHIVQRRIDTHREGRRARSEVAALVGLDSDQNLDVQGPLEPLSEADRLKPGNLREQPEAAVLEAQSRAFSERASAERRARVPSPTLSVFVEKDGFNEHVLGLGLTFPLPLPEPLGRMHAGEIAENEALARRAALLSVRSRRVAKADFFRALVNYEALLEATHAYTKDRLQRSERTLASLVTEVEAGRIGIRDAVISQQPLFELLLGAVEAQRLLCVASADLARAAGVPLEDGGAR